VSQQLRQCQGCDQWRHATAFRRYAIFCVRCENEQAFEAEGREWENRVVEEARDVLRAAQSPAHFDLGASFARAEAARIGEEVGRILSEKRPAVVPRRAWKLVQERNEGKTLQEAATACKLDAKAAFDLERETMVELVARARMNLKRGDDERENPGDDRGVGLHAD
jgi:hypothetical protein